MRHAALSALVIGDPSWMVPCLVLALAGLLLTVLLNRRRLQNDRLGPGLRITGWVLLCVCLLNPLWSSSRPKSGANVVAVIVDNSRSHLVETGGGQPTRAEVIRESLQNGERAEPVGWVNRLSQDFELRRYVVGDRLQQVDHFEPVEFNGTASSLQTALQQVRSRFDGQPLAAVLLITDGNATDAGESLEALRGMPPVFPIVPADDGGLPDVSVGTVSVSQTAFDDAPVTLQLLPTTVNVASGRIAVTLVDEQGNPVETLTHPVNDPNPIRFRHRPAAGGTVFYRLQTALQSDDGTQITDEATTVNNEQLVAVDRGSMPRRILYVAGRPNWEFKFLRRAVETDSQLQIVALIRIARKEAKFDFRGRDGETSNSLFRGFDGADKELTEEYDEPVLVRLNTKDDDELRGGFPESADQLFQYDAIVLDDLESEFFLADQLKLIHDFVSRRGGGLLMMGGQESFRPGGYDRTPVGELLPIDLSREVPTPGTPVRMALSRDGWLQPWVRLRSDELAEEERLNAMPEFLTLNTTGFIRPGAVEMARVEDAEGQQWPALVVQRFGKGRSAALCIGDLWRWRLNDGLRQLHGLPSGIADGPSDPAPADGPVEDLSDHSRACRQLMRWLVADVPRRLDVSVDDDASAGSGSVRLTARVRSANFEPSENADVRFTCTAPDGKQYELSAEPSDEESGTFEALLSANQPGGWRASVTAVVAEEATPEPLVATIGWAYEPDQREMKSVNVNRAWLNDVAEMTGGRVVDLEDVDSFTESLPTGGATIQEVHSWPVWHSWLVFLSAVACFATDWTLRRKRGLP